MSIRHVEQEPLETVYYTTRGYTYHTRRGCRALDTVPDHNVLRASADNLPSRRKQCRWCSGRSLVPNTERKRNQCTCGCGSLDGECEFSKRYERVHDIPPDYDIAFGRRFAQVQHFHRGSLNHITT